MTEAILIGLMREAAWVGLVIAAPILGVALVVGLLIGLVQALTSIQELTLTFVPKMLAIMVMFWATLGFMAQGLVGFFQNTIIGLVAGGGCGREPSGRWQPWSPSACSFRVRMRRLPYHRRAKPVSLRPRQRVVPAECRQVCFRQSR